MMVTNSNGETSMRLLIVAATVIALTGPAAKSYAQKSPKLAQCDGSRKRPANPYGTVLPRIDLAAPSDPAAPVPAPGAPPGANANVDVFTQPVTPDREGGPTVPEIGAATPRARFESC